MKYSFINKVGLELEGGWTDIRGFHLVHDGSVNIDAPFVGEVVSKPLEPSGIETWLFNAYPDVLNETCGLHVHVSVKNPLYYAHLMELEFQEYLIKALITWGNKIKIRADHPFWSRVRGENTYASFNFWPERQWDRKEHHGERYTALNYTWARFQTVECRVLPGFKQKECALGAIFAVIDAFETFLETKKDFKDIPEIYTFSDEDLKDLEELTSKVELFYEKEDANFFLNYSESAKLQDESFSLITIL